MKNKQNVTFQNKIQTEMKMQQNLKKNQMFQVNLHKQENNKVKKVLFISNLICWNV